MSINSSEIYVMRRLLKKEEKWKVRLFIIILCTLSTEEKRNRLSTSEISLAILREAGKEKSRPTKVNEEIDSTIKTVIPSCRSYSSSCCWCCFNPLLYLLSSLSLDITLFFIATATADNATTSSYLIVSPLSLSLPLLLLPLLFQLVSWVKTKFSFH